MEARSGEIVEPRGTNVVTQRILHRVTRLRISFSFIFFFLLSPFFKGGGGEGCSSATVSPTVLRRPGCSPIASRPSNGRFGRDMGIACGIVTATALSFQTNATNATNTRYSEDSSPPSPLRTSPSPSPSPPLPSLSLACPQNRLCPAHVNLLPFPSFPFLPFPFLPFPRSRTARPVSPAILVLLRKAMPLKPSPASQGSLHRRFCISPFT